MSIDGPEVYRSPRFEAAGDYWYHPLYQRTPVLGRHSALVAGRCWQLLRLQRCVQAPHPLFKKARRVAPACTWPPTWEPPSWVSLSTGRTSIIRSPSNMLLIPCSQGCKVCC